MSLLLAGSVRVVAAAHRIRTLCWTGFSMTSTSLAGSECRDANHTILHLDPSATMAIEPTVDAELVTEPAVAADHTVEPTMVATMNKREREGEGD